jgi:integrase
MRERISIRMAVRVFDLDAQGHLTGAAYLQYANHTLWDRVRAAGVDVDALLASTASNWSRAWRRALRQIDHPPLRVCDCRHAAATTWLVAGVPLGEVARRMGHSVDTLVSTYVGALTGDQDLANRRIDALLAGGRSWPR